MNIMEKRDETAKLLNHLENEKVKLSRQVRDISDHRE